LHALLIHPAVQAVLAPFLVALLTAELLQRLRLSGLSAIAGLAVTVYLVSGFSYAPLTTNSKIIWICIGSGLLAIPLIVLNTSLWRPLLTVLGAAAGVWVAQRLLLQHSTPVALQWGLGLALYVGWQVFWMDTLHELPVRASSAGIALGLGSGAVLMIAGATLMGKYNLAIGSAAAAFLFIMFVSNSHLMASRSFTLPLALLSALTTSLAVLSGKLPWYILSVFALIPLTAKLPVADRSAVWVQATLLTTATLAVALGAVYISWRIHGWHAF
jgi:hypothetical protein